jgi:hypothetical protein
VVFHKYFTYKFYFQVLEGVDTLLFNLLVLGSLTDYTGFVWKRSVRDLYVIETTPLLQKEKASIILLLAIFFHAANYVNNNVRNKINL